MTPPEPGAKLQAILNQAATQNRTRRWRTGLVLLLLGVSATLAYVQLGTSADTAKPHYRTENATVGNLVVQVSATGHLQPTKQVDVGSELSGIVEAVLVDDNDLVQRGQELVRLDLSKLQDTVAKSQANLALAEAQVLQAQATQAETRAQWARLRQVAQLSDGKVPAQHELASAAADVQRAEASVAIARAGVAQAQASLRSDTTNLAKAHIRSPINGIVLARKVEPGQTVAASLQAPVLLTLAEDLAQMQLQVDVDEADVGRIQPGQEATFSVDAWPGRNYHARITRISYGAQTKNGVVSYLTTLAVKNDDLSLRPGMTGTAEITTLARTNILLVPNAALRFTHTTTEKPAKQTSIVNLLMPRTPRPAPKVRLTKPMGASQLWVLRDAQAVPVAVQTGASDGKHTEIIAGAIQAGTPVITDSLAKPP